MFFSSIVYFPTRRPSGSLRQPTRIGVPPVIVANEVRRRLINTAPGCYVPPVAAREFKRPLHATRSLRAKTAGRPTTPKTALDAFTTHGVWSDGRPTFGFWCRSETPPPTRATPSERSIPRTCLNFYPGRHRCSIVVSNYKSRRAVPAERRRERCDCTGPRAHAGSAPRIQHFNSAYEPRMYA